MMKSDQQARRSVPITYLEPALWRHLTEADAEQEYCLGWLQLQCRIIDDCLSGIVILGDSETGPFRQAAAWPDTRRDYQHLSSLIEQVIKEQKGVVLGNDPEGKLNSAADVRHYIGYPVRLEKQVVGLAALELTGRTPIQLQSAMRQLQWGIAWLENWMLRQRNTLSDRTRTRLATAFELIALILQEKRFRDAATSFVTELATRLKCDRASLGFVVKNHVKVFGISHSAHFGRQMNLIQAIGKAMDESVDQGEVVNYASNADNANIIREHELLARGQGSKSILTLPFLQEDGGSYGALMLERSIDTAFDKETEALCRAVASLAGPILREKRENDRILPVKIVESMTCLLKALFGPSHLVMKGAATVLAALVIFFVLAEGNYRVTARSTLEGTVQRAVAVSFDGFIENAPVRAGDVVSEGQVLARLDDRDLKLERFKWVSQREQHMFEYHKAMSEGDIAASKILLEQANQAEARIWLIDQNLSRTEIVAPIGGLVVSGDHSQSLGAPVRQGDILYEIAPLDSYRIVLEIDEWEIERIRDGQKGNLVLSALPAESYGFEVTKITPVAIAREGETFFEVEARLEEPSPRLRPGMVGYGKIDIDERLLIWVWTHDMIDWLRLRFWAFWP